MKSNAASPPEPKWKRFKRWVEQRLFPIFLFVCGTALLAVVAAKTSSAEPPSFTESAALLFISGSLQVWAGLRFGRAGQVSEQQARSSIRHLVMLGLRLRDARYRFNEAVEISSAESYERAVREGNALVASAMLDVEAAMASWDDVRPGARSEALERLRIQQTDLESYKGQF